jgi:hypothetical protein
VFISSSLHGEFLNAPEIGRVAPAFANVMIALTALAGLACRKRSNVHIGVFGIQRVQTTEVSKV